MRRKKKTYRWINVRIPVLSDVMVAVCYWNQLNAGVVIETDFGFQSISQGCVVDKVLNRAN